MLVGKLYGYSTFIRRDKLLNEENGLCLMDTVIFEIGLSVIKNWVTQDTGAPSPLQHLTPIPPTWSQDMARFLEGVSEHGDLSIMVGNECFRAHRAILMGRSPVFCAMLGRCGLMESRSSEISLDEIAPAVFEALLHFLYTDTIPGGLESLPVEMAQHLLHTADKFDCPRLRSLCERRLLSALDAESVCDTLMLAEAAHASELAARCITFFIAHVEEVLGTAGYASLCQRADAGSFLRLLASKPQKRKRPFTAGSLSGGSGGYGVERRAGGEAAVGTEGTGGSGGLHLGGGGPERVDTGSSGAASRPATP